MRHLFIVGTGYVGLAAGAYFGQKGWQISGLVRQKDRVRELQVHGIEAIVGDILIPNSFECPINIDSVLFALSPHERTDEAYQKIYVEGTRNVLKKLPKSVKRIVYLSTTGVWSEMHGEWVDETTPITIQTPRQRILLEAERQVLESGFNASILRLGGIYGPGRNRIEALKRGIWPSQGLDRYLNLVYRDDIPCAIERLLGSQGAGEIYICTDGQPVLQSTLYKWLSLKLGLPLARVEGLQKPPQGKRCRNEKLKKLGFVYQYPTFQEGYEAILTR